MLNNLLKIQELKEEYLIESIEFSSTICNTKIVCCNGEI